MKNYIRIFRDGELNPAGVTSVWKWQCNHWDCLYRTTDNGTALFWQNALKGANYHIKWHKNRRPDAKI